jgi:hypothetical protein
MAKEQTITLYQGLKANIATAALESGEMGFCTDTKEVFIGDGTGINFVGRALSGTEAARPNAGNQGRLYYVTSGNNMGYIYHDSGSAWVRINAQKLSEMTGSLDDIADGTTYARVKKSDITGGQVNKISDGTNTKTAAEVKTHIDDAAKHRLINDSGNAVTDLWSAQKIQNEIELAKHNIEPQASVKDQNLTTPPGSPVSGDRYIIPASPSGAWVSQTGKIAEWNGSAWTFYAPQVGWTCYVDDEQKVYSWNGSAWVRTGGALQTITAGNGLTGGGQSDTVTLTVGAGNGITVGSTTVSAKAGKGIVVNSTGIEADVDGATIVYGTGNKLTVAAVRGGTF